MNKVICDVCGTTFPETAARCPICGCAKQPTAQAVVADESQSRGESSASNNYSKGGRFAKNNVKNNSRRRASEGRFSSDKKQNNDTEAGSKGLIAVVIILLLAIVMVVVYIGVKVFFPEVQNNADQSGNQTTTAPLNGGNNGGGQSIPCTSIQLNSKTVELNVAGSVYALSVEKEPKDTTDTVKFESSDPTIVTVDDKGNISPVGYGTATITVSCGPVSEQCTVVSTVGEPPATTPPTTPPVTLPDGFKLKLKTYQDTGEITLSEKWPTAQLYTTTNGVTASDITWTISDPAIAKVENGKAIGLSKGTCTITATIGDQTATCKAIVTFDAPEPTPYKLNATDKTLYGGGTSASVFYLSLQEIETGAKVNVEWYVSEEGIVEVSENGKVTACDNVRKDVTVYTEYEGVKYSCIFRVHPKPAED